MYVMQRAGLGDLIEIWTPDEMKLYILSVARQVDSFDRDVAANLACLDPTFVALWDDYKINFAAFLADTSWFDRLWIGTVRVAERFAEELHTLQGQYQVRCGVAPTTTIPVTPGQLQQRQIASTGRSLVWVAAGVLSVYGAFKIMQAQPWRRWRAA